MMADRSFWGVFGKPPILYKTNSFDPGPGSKGACFKNKDDF